MEQGKVNIIQNQYDRLQGLIKHVGEKYPERKWLYEPAPKYFELLHEDLMQGKPLLWYFFLLSPELFRALDVAPFSPEYTGGILASNLGGINKYIDLAQEKIPDHVCSINKFAVGAALSGDLPLPDMMIYPTGNPCDSQTITYSILAHYFDVPQFALDTPYWNNERSYKYFANELKRMVSFIEEQTKRKLDLDRLREIIEYSNRAYEYMVKIDELRKLVPCPIPSRSTTVTGGAMMGLAGTPELVDWCERYYKMAQEKVQKGEGAIPQERIRIAWIANHVNFDSRLVDWLEEKFGAIGVIDLLELYLNKPIETTSEEKIFEGLAFKTMSYPMGRHGRGPAETYIKECIDMCRDYKVDAVIFAGNVGCKFNWAIAQLVKDMIYDELEIPTLCFDLDPSDPRVASPENVRAKFEQFFDTLPARG